MFLLLALLLTIMPRFRDAQALQKEFASAQQEVRADYLAGKNSRFLPAVRGILASGSGADYHYRSEPQFLYMIERAREFDRNNLVVAQGINRLVANIMQDGFSLDVQTGDANIDEQLGARFWDWGCDPDQCDDEQERDFETLADLALRHTIVDGDCLGLPTEDDTLQMVEAHRMRRPTGTTLKNNVHGILFDERKRRKEYWITKQDLSPFQVLSRVGDVEKYAARDKDGYRQVLHVYDPKRFSQSRGVTAFATLVYALGLHDDIQFATLVKQQVAACFAILREIPDNGDGNTKIPNLATDAAAETGKRYTEDLEDGTTRTVGGISPGMTVRSRPGEKLQGFAPNIPSPEFFTHAHMVLQFVAINLDLPLQVFLLDPTETNFSGWRGAIDQARIRFRKIQKWLIGKFHTPVYQWRVRRAIRGDAVLRKLYEKKSGKYEKALFGHKWNPPTWKYIEPLKDAQADDLREEKNLASGRQLAAEKGQDFDDLYKECFDDRFNKFKYAAELAEKLNALPGFKETKVTWRDIASQAPPTGVKVIDPNTLVKAQQGDSGANN